ncbi:putative LPS assembly protein LptD [Desertivirga arenae]|uniref:putative LPS assembly protein LptD n=1 Tax=Desertivirga arenae TaxID=2810309 RepID=UPI001A957B45|nr:putative LPS assembly protein LptD [Pedobacter sp. SYSU D00823]
MKLDAQQTQNTPKPITRKTDTVTANLTDTLKKKSTSGLNSVIEYHAEDSIRFNIDRTIVYLYGNARVSYEEMELSADFIRLDQKNKAMFASGLKDKYGKYRGRPIFKQGQEPPVSTDSLIYNMESKKGLVYSSFTEVEGGYISAATSKKSPYDEVSFKNGVYSTCNLPHPHFGIHISKGIITKKRIVSGPSYLEIEDIPFPAVLPFGFFPKTNKRASGFHFPSVGEDGTLGFYLRNTGWYFGINDYWDADVLATIYSKGSYLGNLAVRYRKNYKFNGGLNFAYSSTLPGRGVEGTESYKPSKNFSLSWTHQQNAAAHPGVNFGANVSIQTAKYFTESRAGASYDVNQLTRSQSSSSINYGRTFANNLFNFSASARSSQDFSNSTVNLELPSFNLSMTTLNPFENKNGTGEQKWYEKISVGYSMQGNNSVTEKEYDLFDKGFKNAQNGITQNIPISIAFSPLKYLQFSTGTSYNERWTFRTVRYNYNEEAKKVDTSYVRGFARNFDYGLNGSLSTKFYGMKNFKKGKVSAIRHIVTPSTSFNYTPNFGSDNFGFFRSYYNSTTGATTRYSIFEGSGISAPGMGRSASMSFSLDNTIEAKVKTTGDTANAFKKIPILQGLNFTGSYNFLADSFKLSPISFSGRTALFDQKLGLNFGGTFNPYQVGANGREIDAYTFRNGRLPRLTAFTFSTGYNFNSAALKKRQENLEQQQENPQISQQQRQDISTILNNPNQFVDFTIPWSFNFTYSLTYTKTYNNLGAQNNLVNSLNFNGDFSVTPKWKVMYTSGWDFEQKTFTMTSFSIARDLHCWDMSFNWVPFGPYKSYSFDLRVRASILQDLKLSRRSAYNPITL